MISNMRRRFLFALLAMSVGASVCAAKDVYVAQNATGAGSGQDCANARPATFFNTGSNWGTGASQIAPGDTVHLCGVFTGPLTIQGSGTSGNLITILFEPNARMTSFFWPVTGAIGGDNRSFIVIDGGTNGLIEATANGTALTNQTNSAGVILTTCNDCEVRNLTVRNMYVRTPGSGDTRSFGAGIVIQGGNNVSIHDNTVTEAKTGVGYACLGGRTATNVKLFNNRVSRISQGVAVAAGDISAVCDGVDIFNNEVFDGLAWTGNWNPPPGDGHHHNDPIHVFAVASGAAVRNLRIHSNFIHGDWSRGFATGWIFVEQLISDYRVYNNLLTASNGSAPTDGFIIIRGPGDNIGVYNNTIVGDNGGIGVQFCCGSTGNEAKNNIIRNVGTGIFVDDSSAINSSNFNAISGLSISAPMFYQIGFFSFALWQSRLGFDANTITLDPALDTNFKPTITSPAVDRGTNLNTFFTLDKRGQTRGQGNNLWDIGCFELVRPNPPTNLRPGG